jgi:hypothetical protein
VIRRHFRLAIVARRLLLAAASIAALAGLVAACESGEGERCQIDDDCKPGLVCNQATAQCASSTSALPIDATVPDLMDAELDPDAPVDVPDI